MKYINILHATTNIWFLHQIDHLRFDSEYIFYENSNKEIIWDLVVVYECIQDSISLKYKKGGLLFISGEPPMSNIYSRNFLRQFDMLITSHPNITHPNNKLCQQALPWHYGIDYNTKKAKFDFAYLQNIESDFKTKNISVITSSKKMMPGHNRRIKFLNLLKEKFPNKIDYYGMGVNPVLDKAEAILPYRFHICIENSQIYDYWTEKLADPLLGFSIPIYIGCLNIDKYFNTEGMYILSLDNENDILETISKILVDPEKAYQSKLSALRNNRLKLLNEFNIFSLIDKTLKEDLNIESEQIETTIKNNSFFVEYKLRMIFLRLKRMLYKIFN